MHRDSRQSAGQAQCNFWVGLDQWLQGGARTISAEIGLSEGTQGEFMAWLHRRRFVDRRPAPRATRQNGQNVLNMVRMVLTKAIQNPPERKSCVGNTAPTAFNGQLPLQHGVL